MRPRTRERARLVPLVALLAACAEPDELRLVVLGTTDVHGYLVPYSYATGEPTQNSLAQAATLIDSVRRVEDHVILVDSGDLLQGAALDEYQVRVARDPVHPVIAAMNALDYDASAIGNHEFNYGIEFLESTLAASEIPFLAANIVIAGTDSLLFRPYTLVERGGLTVGIISFTTPGVLIWDQAHVEGRLGFHDMVDAARLWVPRMREDGAEVVVVAAHSGLGPGSSYGEVEGVPEENALARMAVEVPGIDVIFAGHTAVAVAGERVGGTLIVQAGRHADHLAVAEIEVRRTRAGLEISSSGRVIPTYGVAPSEELVELVRDPHERTIAWLGEPIGYTPDRWTSTSARIEDSPIADLVTRVQAEVSGADLSAAAVFRLGLEFGPGAITRRDILGLYVYPNTLRAVRVNGDDIRAYLERSAVYFHTLPGARLINDSVPGYNFDIIEGVDYALDLTREAGTRVVSLTRDGREVTARDSFTLALSNYRQSGGGGFGMVTDAPVVYADETEIATRILDFVSSRDTLRTSDVHVRNWELRPAEEVRRLNGAGG